MFTENDIRKALDKMEVSTARGRAELDGRAIPLEPKNHEVMCHAQERETQYLRLVAELADVVSCTSVGITDAELEKVEFVREQLIALARTACETRIKAL